MASVDQETSTDTLREHVPDRHLDESLRVLDLEKEADEVRRTEPFRDRGLSAKTLAKYDDLRLVLITIKAGTNMTEHRSEGRLSIQTLSGNVMLKFDDRQVLLPAGSVATLERCVPHDVVALADSTVLLTVCWEGHLR